MASILLGKGDQIAARRPDRCAAFASAEADAVLVRAVGIHHINLLAAAAVGFKRDLLAVRREGRRGVNGRIGGEARGLAAAQIHHIDVGVAVFFQGERHLVAIGRETRAEGHVGKIAQHLLLAGFDVEQIHARLGADIRHVSDHLGGGIEARRQHHVIAASEEVRVGAVFIHDRQALDAFDGGAGFGNEDDAGVEIAFFAGDALIDGVRYHMGNTAPAFRLG